MSAVNITTGLPIWRRVTDLSDLVEIFDPEVQVCVWQRNIDPAVMAYLDNLGQADRLQTLETLSAGSRPCLDCLPPGPGRERLIDDLSFLGELVCTYQGPGTQWLDDQSINRHDLCNELVTGDAYVQALPGDVVLLKGALWPGNEAFGAIHRSPSVAPDACLRTLVTLDPF